MYNKVKLSKRQMKEDKFTSFMLTSKQYASENWQFIVIGVVIVALAIVGVGYFFDSQKVKRTEAAELFSRAMLDFRNGNNQVALLGFKKIVDEHGNSDNAGQASFLLGKINFELRNYPEAIKFYETYIEKYKNNPLNLAASYGGIAASHENQSEFELAAENYQKAFNGYQDGPQNGDYLVSAMRNYLETGDKLRAKDNLDIIRAKFKGSLLESRAIRLFAEKTG